MTEHATLGWHSLGTTFRCACGQTHSLPIKECVVDPDAAALLANYARNHCGKRALVLADENTVAAAGEDVLRLLRNAGKDATELVFGAAPFDATVETAQDVTGAGRNADFVVAIGSGTLTDLAKYAGDKLSRPVLLYPTAASMNGYTSGIVALKVRGLKRTLPCTPAEAVFANPEIAAAAPPRMTAAGVADFLSKCSSSTDWRMAHLLRDDYYCDRPREFFEGIQEKLLGACPAIGKGEAPAVAVALEALLLSGCSMVIAGSSAPASGGEHLISHYLDMKSALNGTPHDLHGAQVGVATIHCLELWERIFALDPASIDVDARIAALPNPADVAATIESDWGTVALEVQEQWDQKTPDPQSLQNELARFAALDDAARESARSDLLASGTVAEAIAHCGGPTTAEALDVPLEDYRDALHRARYIRSRFTVLDLAAELGVD